MATTIRLKSSVVKDKVPAAGDIQIGEVCVGAHPDSPMLLFKDSSNNIIKIEPADAEGILWEAQAVSDDTYISPKETTSVLYLPDGPDNEPRIHYGPTSNSGGTLYYRPSASNSDKYWVFRPYEDSPSGTPTPEVRISGVGHVEARTFAAAEGTSQAWDTAGGTSFEATNYNEVTFAASPMGDVDIRRNLVVGNTGSSGARTHGHIEGISPDDLEATEIGFSLKFGDTTPFSVDYTGEVTAGKFVGDGSGLTNLPVAAGLWKEDGDAVTPIAEGADLMIEGNINSAGNILTGTEGSQAGVKLFHGPTESGVAVYCDHSDTGSRVFQAYDANKSGDARYSCSIFNDGRITAAGTGHFKGDVAVGEATTTFLDKAAAIAALTPEQRTLFASAIAAWNARPEPYAADDPSTLPADLPLREAIIRATTLGKINLNGDTGSINAAGDGNFTGNIYVSGGADTPSADNFGLSVTAGGVKVRNDLTSSDAYVFYAENESGMTSRIGPDGSAKFISDVISGDLEQATGGSRINASGSISIRKDTGNGLNANVFNVYSGGTALENITAYITREGTITATTFDLNSLDFLPA